MKKIKIAPEVSLFVAGLGTGIWLMIIFFGIVINRMDVVVPPVIFTIFSSFSALLNWRECRNNRKLAEGITPEEKPAIVEQVDLAEDIMKKPCPPHKWEYKYERMWCVKCDKPPLFEDRKIF